MFLSLATIPTYLHNRGHLRPGDWVDQHAELVPVPGRHRNFAITFDSGIGLFVKQAAEATPERTTALQRESSMLSMFEQRAEWECCRDFAPRLFDHDRFRHVLVIERLRGRSLYETYVSANVSTPPTAALAQQLGGLLARFHDAGRATDLDSTSGLPSEPPVAITLRPPDPGFYANLSPGCRQIIESIQSDDPFFEALRANESKWKCDTVVHGDLKWDNVMVTDDADAPIKLVDWELAGIGDPAWDVAGILHSYVVFDVDQQFAGGGVTTVRGDAQAFWCGYVHAATPDSPDRFADRVRSFLAARLIQSVLEREHASMLPCERSKTLVSLSRSILCLPEASIKHLWSGDVTL